LIGQVLPAIKKSGVKTAYLEIEELMIPRPWAWSRASFDFMKGRFGFQGTLVFKETRLSSHGQFLPRSEPGKHYAATQKICQYCRLVGVFRAASGADVRRLV